MATATDQLLNGKAVYKMLGISQGTFYKMIREGKFPPGLRLGPGVVRWRLSTIEEWLEKLPS